MEEVLKLLNENNSVQENLQILNEQLKGKIVFSTSFGIEDQVITNEIFSNKLENIEVFTLDTGRLFPETYDVWDKSNLKYGNKIKPFYPEAVTIEKYVLDNGINGFYNSVDLRKECCNIRKVQPLNRALKGANVWITGLRAEQSPNRQTMKLIEWDEVVEYLQKKGVPYNTLHHKGFISIGCAPCTRAVKEGEDFRAGRWWWEDQSKKECGLHK